MTASPFVLSAAQRGAFRLEAGRTTGTDLAACAGHGCDWHE